MGARIEAERGFVDHYIECSINPKSLLFKIDHLVDWRPFEKYLSKHLKRGPAAAGQPPYPDLVMFKAILLQFLYGLSDDGLSFALGDRISFLHFIGLPFESSKPDGSTIGRFRNRLAKKNHYRKLLDLFNQQLEKNGLLVKQGVVVDATLIPSSRHPRKTVDLSTVVQDRKEDESTVDSVIVPQDCTENENCSQADGSESVEVNVSYSDDDDAAWTKKGKDVIYGFKLHGAVDSEHGLIIGGHATAANLSDTKEFARLVTESDLPPGAVIEADKGYASKSNRKFLHENGFRDGIMCKGNRGRKLCNEEKTWNRFISKTRWVVERTFGTLKRVQGYARARYLGIDKVEMEFHLHALVHNMKKAINLSA